MCRCGVAWKIVGQNPLLLFRVTLSPSKIFKLNSKLVLKYEQKTQDTQGNLGQGTSKEASFSLFLKHVVNNKYLYQEKTRLVHKCKC